MPRMIDRRLGQELLGVWDFAWSLVTYFTLVQLGVGSSVNRYVAKYRAARDTMGMNQVMSSASCILAVAGLLVLGFTIAVSLLLPQLFGAKLGENTYQAQWVVFLTGAGLSVRMVFSSFHGLLTGYHQWGLHSLIKSGWHVITIVGMIVALLKGGGLPSLAAVALAGQAFEEVTRVTLAYRICKGLHIRPWLVRWKTIRKLFSFGGKTLIPSVSNLLLNQTASIMIVAYLGPAALALYARPRSLVLHVNTLVNKMAMTLTPTVSSLQSINNTKEIRQLLITSVRYSFYLVLPIVLVLVVFGDAVMQFWMGQRYANGLVPAILAIGYLAFLVQRPVLNILAGLNAHGRAGIAKFVASVCSVGLTVLMLGYLKWGIAGAAVAVTLPLMIMNVLYLPLLIRQRAGLGVRQYFRSVTTGPVTHILPFAICLIVGRFVFYDKALSGLLWSGIAGCVVLAILYYRYVLPDRLRLKVSRLMGVRSIT
jgi:O-antigen/teichoic acid export membrane protein